MYLFTQVLTKQQMWVYLLVFLLLWLILLISITSILGYILMFIPNLLYSMTPNSHNACHGGFSHVSLSSLALVEGWSRQSSPFLLCLGIRYFGKPHLTCSCIIAWRYARHTCTSWNPHNSLTDYNNATLPNGALVLCPTKKSRTAFLNFTMC